MNIMKKITAILALLAVVCSLSGCDFFRKLAGRPTSAELEKKLIWIEQIKQMKVDSEEEAGGKTPAEETMAEEPERAASDSLAAVEALASAKVKVAAASEKIGEQARAALGRRYYVVVGVFQVKENADKLYKRVAAKGYEVCLVPFRNGYTAVAVSPSDKISEAYEALSALRSEDFCPSDVWILNNGK